MYYSLVGLALLALGAILLHDPDLMDNHLRHWWAEVTGTPIVDDDE